MPLRQLRYHLAKSWQMSVLGNLLDRFQVTVDGRWIGKNASLMAAEENQQHY
jgi:hypothetical protein